MTQPEPVPGPAPRGRAAGGAVRILAVPLVAAAVSFLGAQLALRPVVAELATRPPVLVLDLAQAVHGLAPDRVDAAIARQRAIAHRLAQGGVLVLDAQAVLDVPPNLVLPAKGPERVP
jgi:hypothetical protein